MKIKTLFSRIGMMIVLALASGLSARAEERAEKRTDENQKETTTKNAPTHKKINVLCSTYPVHQIVRNVAAGGESLEPTLLLPAAAGCPHDYALTPRDMRRIADADVLVVNGLGMESFLNDAVARANPGLVVVDASDGIDELLGFTAAAAPADAGHSHGDGHDHGRDGVNPHLFASPVMSAEIARGLGRRFAEIDAANAERYRTNAEKYAKRLERLAADMTAAVAKFPNNRVVEPHDAFDYLARDIGLDIVAVMQPGGAELSAAGMLSLLDEIRDGGAAAIIVEPQYPARTGEALAGETGLPVLRLDPCASGPEDAPLDYYETTMRANLKALEAALGN